MHKLLLNMEQFHEHHEITLNTLRLMSKVSLSRECCQVFLQNEQVMKNIALFFRTFVSNIYIIIRTAYFLA